MALHPAERKRHFLEIEPVAHVPVRHNTKDNLKENADWYRDLVEHSPDLLSVHDLNGRFLSVNPLPAHLLGYSVEEMLHMRMQDIVAPQFQAEVDNFLREIERTGESHGLMPVTTRSGDQRVWEYHSTLRTEGVATPLVEGIARDVTDRERALHELTLFRTLLDQSSDAIEVLDLKTLRFLDINKRACADLGYSREELLAMTVLDITPGLDDHAREMVDRRLDAAGYVVLEKTRRRKDGTIFPVEVNLRKVQLDKEYAIGVVRDITERKRGERALRSLHACNESLMRATDEQSLLTQICDLMVNVGGYRMAWVGYAVHDESKTVQVAASSGFEAGYLEALNVTWADEERGRGPAGTAIRTGKPSVCHDITTDPRVACWREGALKQGYRSCLGLPLKSDEGVLGAILIYATETGVFDAAEQRLLEELANNLSYGIVALRVRAERARVEEALRQREENQKLILDHLSAGVILVSGSEQKVIYHNPRFLELFGYSIEQFMNVSEWWPLAYPDSEYRESVSTEWDRRMSEAVGTQGEIDPMEVTITCRDGTRKYVRVTCKIIRGLNFVTFIDLTEQKREEEAIAALVQVRADSSENFFNSMATQLAKCLEADYAFIGELIQGEEGKVRTIGVCSQGAIIENSTFDLAHTPSEAILQQGARSYAAGVAEIFPKDLVLKQIKAEGYAGTRLSDSQGRVIGVMAALYTRPLVNAKFAETILQLFSTRTAAEIERKRNEEALRQSEERFRVALKNSPITVFNQDRDLRYIWMYNPQLPGRTNDHLGRTQEDLYDPENNERIEEIRRQVLETGVGARHETQIMDSGRKRYFDTTIEPVFDAAGAVIGITGASTEVTELREANEALREAKRKLTEEKLYLEQEIDTELGFVEIIGQSKALQTVMEQVGKVAASDATVLLLGETGTGKELVARAVHRLSRRSNNSFIKMNCAAIPSGLLESELFGNEKGAFTGAVSKKIGRLELADRGTLFLDEIGDITLALQPKLLRVLQDQEFERLGGTQTLKVNFRLIAATNRDLAESVHENEFRSDLYYRLNVFPIRVPPLRERREDIRLLVEHFVQKFARRMNKTITSIPQKSMDALMAWDWPGNVRELENFIERSVILTQGSVLVSPFSEMTMTPMSAIAEQKDVDETLEAAEREHILRALQESHGRIGGPRGAAMRLGLKRTTLQSKLKHLGINPRPGSPKP